jgi:catechol 2,3-dioxygenase-like lactoylglutathione lyase family enzyme
MKPKLFRIVVMVSDIDRAAPFYETVLGMVGQRVSPGRHYFDCDGTILACLDPNADADPCDVRPLPDYIYFAVDNIEATYDACQKAGAVFADGDVHGDPAGSIARRPWGERSFYAADPFGNGLCFVDRSTVFIGQRPDTV